MLKIRRSQDHLISNMVIPYLGKIIFILREGPGCWGWLLLVGVQWHHHSLPWQHPVMQIRRQAQHLPEEGPASISLPPPHRASHWHQPAHTTDSHHRASYHTQNCSQSQTQGHTVTNQSWPQDKNQCLHYLIFRNSYKMPTKDCVSNRTDLSPLPTRVHFKGTLHKNNSHKENYDMGTYLWNNSLYSGYLSPQLTSKRLTSVTVIQFRMLSDLHQQSNRLFYDIPYTPQVSFSTIYTEEGSLYGQVSSVMWYEVWGVSGAMFLWEVWPSTEAGMAGWQTPSRLPLHLPCLPGYNTAWQGMEAWSPGHIPADAIHQAPAATFPWVSARKT